MTVTLELTPEESALLCALAARDGTDVESTLRNLIGGSSEGSADGMGRTVDSPPALYDSPTAALFRQWQEEDATDDPEEVRRAEEELDSLKSALNANRAANGERLLFP